MSLDIAILGDDGAPARQVAVGLDEHARLMVLAKGLPLLGRLSDYYQDVGYGVSEVPQFLKELVELRALTSGGADLRDLIDNLIALAEDATAHTTPIVAIAD